MDESPRTVAKAAIEGNGAGPSPRRPNPPRLRIHHFMLWTAVTALLLTASTASNVGQLQSQALGFAQASMALWAILVAIDTTVLALGIRWRLAGMAFFNEPGHWIAVDGASAGLLWFGFALWAQSVLGGAFFWLWGIFSLVRSGVMIIVYIVVGRRIANTRSWRAYCWVQAALILLVGIGRFIIPRLYTLQGFHLIYFVIGLAPSVLIIILIACFVGDWRNRTMRHWSHWVAAGAKLIGLGMQTAMMIVGLLSGLG